MQNSGLIFNNLRVKAKENNLLTAEKMMRMSESQTLGGAVRVLQECGYGGGMNINPLEYDKLLAAEKYNAVEFLREASVDKSGSEAFLMTLDYHNAKALYKCKLTQKEAEQTLSPEGCVRLETLRACIETGQYFSLPEEMAKTLTVLDEKHSQTPLTPREIDVMLDGAMFRAITALLQKAKSKEIKQYFSLLADTVNYKSMLRCKTLNLPIAFFKENYVEGGTIGRDKLEAAYEQSLESIGESMRFTALGELAEKASAALSAGGDLSSYELACDNKLLGIFKKGRNDMFSPIPIVGYYLAKINEIKSARLILVCIKNNVDRSVLRQRLREAYA